MTQKSDFLTLELRRSRISSYLESLHTSHGDLSRSVIENGDVYMYDNPQGCNLTPGVSWQSLFANPSRQRYHSSVKFKSTDEEASFTKPCAINSNPGKCFSKNGYLFSLKLC